MFLVSTLSVLSNKEKSFYQKVDQKVDSTFSEGELKERQHTSTPAGATLLLELPPAYDCGH